MNPYSVMEAWAGHRYSAKSTLQSYRKNKMRKEYKPVLAPSRKKGQV